ncbi:MAG TPA: class F sortase [Anaerolineales bacterium]|nr:class F sortase [Anaerolineales bacterium]
MWSVVTAFLVGLLVVLWLASRQSQYRPMFTVRRMPRFQFGRLWWLLAGCVVAGGGLAAYGLTGLVNWPNADMARAEATVAAQGPSRLLIPALQLDERIVGVPVTNKGWDISRLGMHVGWLETTGVKPGDPLAMALIGHVTVSAVQVGPFAELHTLQPLDTIVYRSGGADYVFSVGSIEQVKPEDAHRLYVPKGDHLLLITCTDWNYVTETYDGRLIVDAVLTKQTPSPAAQ